MAVYATGTINSATPATDLMTALDTHITANGWTFVETYTNGTNISNVYKSPGTGAGANSWGTDFYVALGRTSTTSDVRLMLFETWDSTNKKAIKYAPAGSNTVPSGTDYTVNDATGLLLNSATLSITNCVITVKSSSLFTWYANVNVDRMIFGSDGSTSSNMIYAGLFDLLVPGDTFPIAVICVSAGSVTGGTTYGSTTRELFQTSAAANNWSVQMAMGGTNNSTGAATFVYGANRPDASGNFPNANELYTGKPIAQRVYFVSARSVGTAPRGILKGVVHAYGGTTAADTMSYTIGATTYNYTRAFGQTASAAVPSVWMPQQ